MKMTDREMDDSLAGYLKEKGGFKQVFVTFSNPSYVILEALKDGDISKYRYDMKTGEFERI